MTSHRFLRVDAAAARRNLVAVAAACAVVATVNCAKGDTSASGGANAPVNLADADSAGQAITATDMLQHIKDLADDSMEGRGPGTPGESTTRSPFIATACSTSTYCATAFTSASSMTSFS